MCQAFQGEQAFYLATKRAYRKEGYDAFTNNIAKSDAPDCLYREDWEMGWELANRKEGLF